jgi:hypothetical protein
MRGLRTPLRLSCYAVIENALGVEGQRPPGRRSSLHRLHVPDDCTKPLKPGTSSVVVRSAPRAGIGLASARASKATSADNAILHDTGLSSDMMLLQKPFTVDGLLFKVREALNR